MSGDPHRDHGHASMAGVAMELEASQIEAKVSQIEARQIGATSTSLQAAMEHAPHATPVPSSDSTELGAGVSSLDRRPGAVGPGSVERDGPELGLGASAAGSRRPFSWKQFFWALSPLAVLGLLVAVGVPLCPSNTLLGIPCPGCGLTRATEAMLVGDLGAMLRFHPLAPLITPVAVYSVGRVTLISAGVIDSSSVDRLGKLPRYVWGAMAFGLAGLWLVRAVGLLGGLPDPIDPTGGLLYRAGHALYVMVAGA